MRLILTIVMLFPITLSFSQKVVVEGIVSGSGKPLFAVPVALTGTTYSTLTDEKGYYKLSGIPPGKYKLLTAYLGYHQWQKELVLNSDQTVVLNIELKENASDLNEVVITGTMKEVSRMESTVPVEVYTPKFFQKNPSPSLFESIGMINGVKPQLNCNVCNTGDIHINGLEGPYTMITIDGMPIVSALSTVYGLHGIPNSLIQRIEVVKGPASALYGSEAVGGLINIITKSAYSAPVISVDVSTTSFLEHSADAAFKVQKGKVAALISTSHFNFNERWDVNKDNFTDVTLSTRTSVFTKFNLQRKDYRQAALALRYVNEDRFGGEMQWTPEFRGTDSIYGESIYTRRWEAIGFYQLPLKEKVVFSMSVNNHEQDSYYGTTPYMATQRIAFGQLTWDKKIRNHDMMLGAAIRQTYYDDNTSATYNFDNNQRGNNASVTSLPGIFIQDEIEITQQHKLLAGLRYDYNSHHGNIITPRLGYKWSKGENTVLRINGGTGFRVVNLFTEDHAALTGARKVLITESLLPERSYNANINYIKQFSVKWGYIGFDMSAFYTYFTNQILPDYSSDPKLIVYKNLQGNAVSRGYSLNADFNAMNGIKILAGFTLMESYVEDASLKTPILFAPAFSGTWTASYTFSLTTLTFDVSGNINSPMHLPVLPNDFRPAKSPWFALMNLQLTYKFKKGFEIYGGGKNILNFMPDHPIMRPHDPFNKSADINNPYNYTFDPSYNYAPVQGVKAFLGIRYILNQRQ